MKIKTYAINAAITFFVLASVYIWRFKEYGARGYLTWEVPDFAFINNQIILHVGAHIFNPTNRVIIGPDLKFPAIYGLKAQNIPVSQIFLVNEVKYNGTSMEVDTMYDAVISNAESIRITNRYEAFWNFIFKTFIISVFIIGGKWREQAHEIMENYKLSYSPIKHCVNIAMSQYPIESSIGIHLRTWSKDTSLAKTPSQECETIHKSNPLKLLWSCRMEVDELHRAIAFTPEDVPVFISTDNPKSEIIDKLKRKNSSRNIYLINYNKLLDDCTTQHSMFDREHMFVHGSALIDSELLAKSHIFIGNMFSTFSNVVALKRSSDNTHFLQTSSQHVLEKYLFYWIVLGWIVIFMTIVACMKIRIRKTQYKAVKSDDKIC